MADDRSVEQILTGIADELKPEVDKLVAEIGREQVLSNIQNGLERLHERLRQREALFTPKGSA